MGFAELSIADIAAEYQIETQTVFELCDRFKINYKNERTCLALEDAKTVIMEILAARDNSESNWEYIIVALIVSRFVQSDKIGYCLL